MDNLVIPEMIRKLQMRLQVTSAQFIPSFDPVWNWCHDSGKINTSESYKTQSTNADFILFLGVHNDAGSGTLAYATFCVLGRRILCLRNYFFLNFQWDFITHNFHLKMIKFFHHFKILI
jgi:hypothetical protein